jgi:hypothetical protein
MLNTDMKAATIFLLSLIFVCSALKVVGQGAKNALSKSIVITSKHITIQELLRVFSKQTSVEFSFNSRKISPAKKIPVSKERQSLSTWLQFLKKEVSIDYKLIGNHVILVDLNRSPSVARSTATISQKPINNSGKSGDNLTVKSGNSNRQEISKSLLDSSRTLAKKNDTSFLKNSTSGRSADSTAALNRTNQLKSIEGSKLISSKKDSLKVSTTSTKTSNQSSSKAHKRKERKEERESKWGDQPDTESVYPLTKVDIGGQGVGISFERKLGRNTTIDFSGGLGGGYALTDKLRYKVTGLHGPDVYASINPRFYIGRGKRVNAGKSVYANSGNYLGIRLKYVTDYFTENFIVWDVLLFNIHAGIQRNLNHRWLINAHAGPGAAHGYYYGVRLYPSLELKLSYVFNPKK